jgi:hypothetical protein
MPVIKFPEEERNLSKIIFKIFLFILLTIVCFIPLGIYLGANYLFTPQGFWQNLVLFGIAAYFMWSVQFVLFIAWVIFGLAIIFDIR